MYLLADLWAAGRSVSRALFGLNMFSMSYRKDLGAGVMYLPVIGVLSFLLWYRPIYNAYGAFRTLVRASD